MTDLGRHMYSQNLVLRGRLDEAGWRSFLIECVAVMDMEASGEAAIWTYPTSRGKGGNGQTICQPMTESFICLDTWPDHEGSYLHISSCRRFDFACLIKTIKSFDLGLQFVGAMEVLSL